MWPHRRQPTRLPRAWDSSGKNTGVGCHFLLQCMKVKSESEVAQSCLTLSHPIDCSLPGSSIHGIFQARVLEWGANVFLSPFLFLLSAWSTTPSMSLAQAVLPHQLSRNTLGIRAGRLPPPPANRSLLCCCCSAAQLCLSLATPRTVASQAPSFLALSDSSVILRYYICKKKKC